MFIPYALLVHYLTEHGWQQDKKDPSLFTDDRGWIFGFDSYEGLISIRHALETIAVWSPKRAHEAGQWLLAFAEDEVKGILEPYDSSYELPDSASDTH